MVDNPNADESMVNESMIKESMADKSMTDRPMVGTGHLERPERLIQQVEQFLDSFEPYGSPEKHLAMKEYIEQKRMILDEAQEALDIYSPELDLCEWQDWVAEAYIELSQKLKEVRNRLDNFADMITESDKNVYTSAIEAGEKLVGKVNDFLTLPPEENRTKHNIEYFEKLDRYINYCQNFPERLITAKPFAEAYYDKHAVFKIDELLWEINDCSTKLQERQR